MPDAQSILSAFKLPPMFDVSGGGMPPSAPQQPAMPSTMEGAIQAKQKADADAAAKMQPQIDAAQKGYQGAVADVSKAQGEVPKFTAPVNHAQHMDPQQMREQANWMLLAASLAGLLTRQPLTAAMTAGAAAMKGLREGDQARYDEGIKEYERQYKSALDQFKSETEAYKQILSNKEWNAAQKLHEWQMKATEFRDQLARNTSDYKTFGNLIKHREDVQAKMQAHSDMMALRRDTLAARTAGAAGGGGSTPKETVDFYAQMSLNGDWSWVTGLARGKEGQALIRAVKERIPSMAAERNMGPSDVAAAKASMAGSSKALAERQKWVASAQQFISNFTKQADLVDKYMKPGTGGSVPVFNRWIQAGRRAVAGDPDVTKLDVAIRGLAREHQRIVTGVTSNAQLHAAAQKTADELLNINMTADQMKASLEVMREEAQNALDSGNGEVDLLKSQISAIGKPADAPAAGGLPAGWSVKVK